VKEAGLSHLGRKWRGDNILVLLSLLLYIANLLRQLLKRVLVVLVFCLELCAELRLDEESKWALKTRSTHDSAFAQ
jgi:hypothetical protein